MFKTATYCPAMTLPPLARILYVEDDPGIQAVARIALERKGGFTVAVCDGGQKAIDVAPGFAPDLILLDVMMPGMDGIVTCKALRAIPQTAATPVVFVTAKVQPYEIEMYQELGAVDVIRKPFDPMTLSEAVADIWARYHAID